MGIPAYMCSERLRMVWHRPVQEAGFSFEILSEERRLPQDTIALSEARILSRTGQVFVCFYLAGSPDRLGNPVEDYRLMTLWFKSKSSRSLAQFVTRTFLASGAKGILAAPYCKRLYECPAELLHEWPVRFSDTGFSVDLDSALLMNSTERQPDSRHFIQGFVRPGSCRVEVFTGPAINVDSNQIFFYIGFDYQIGVFSNQSAQINPVITKIDELLQTWGARPIGPIIVPPPWKGHRGKKWEKREWESEKGAS